MLKPSYQINSDRLWATILELSEIGNDPNGGITRLSLTDADMEAREYIIFLMQEAGLSVRTDAVGNIIGRLPGIQDAKPAVITGSHIDTVTQGGMFDGALGVLAGIEAARTIVEAGIKLTHPLEVVSFTDEEGTRFGSGFIGSKGMIGELTEAHFALTDANGVTYAEAFKYAGLDPKTYRDAMRQPEEIKAYIELHIEQGEILEREDLPVGIAKDVRGPALLDVSFVGQANHAGTTPMAQRKDPALAMAEALLMIEKIAIKWEGVATVGKVKLSPGGTNIIPEAVEFSIDFRHTDKTIRQQMKKEIIKLLRAIAKQKKLTLKTDLKLDVDPVSCSPEIVNKMEQACWDTSLPAYRMHCGAGHDALLLGKITNFGIIFVRSKDGGNHPSTEWSSKEDCSKGAQVLLQTLLYTAAASCVLNE
ncbi:Zn-dependent hydrolase [Virgibacillus sp. W0430]|uniref:Zn-dependent hydrolase n=1 Tax=Virgibacillus sp. W0430 TaxID=3391580 RepID=UPI003F455707